VREAALLTLTFSLAPVMFPVIPKRGTMFDLKDLAGAERTCL